MSTGSLILVTGVSGYLGAHVVHQLLEAGYRIRATTRSKKVKFVQGWYTQYGDRVEVVAVDDIISGDYSAALEGVEAVIHVAAPLVGRAATYKEQIDAGVKGTLNILVQGEKAGITKFALVSSIAAAAESIFSLGNGTLITDKDWNPITLEQGLDSAADAFTVYCAEKTLAERAAWDFADKHPHVEITTVNPPFFLGPMAPEWDTTEPGPSALSTNHILYDLLRRNGPLRPNPSSVDVRDVARALVLSLNAPPTSQVGRKRILMSGEWFVPAEAVAYVAEMRPELKGRLNEAWKKEVMSPKNNIDNSRAKEVLGLELTDWRKTVLDGVDSLIALETEWKSRGWVPPQ